MGSVLSALRRFADFRGRSRRQEYWSFVLATAVLSLAANVIDRVLDARAREAGAIGLVSWLVAAMLLIPGCAVAVRRLHDTDRRGWWLLLLVAPVIVPLVVVASGAESSLVLIVPVVCVMWLVVLFCLDGTRGDNRFGPDPKRPAEHWRDVFG